MAMISHLSEIQHTSVMSQEVIEWLVPKPGQIFVDCTFGAGGHTRELLNAADCRVIAIDKDLDAINGGEKLAKEFSGRLEIVHSSYDKIDEVLESKSLEQVDGILIDAGVSSHQIDTDTRGFSFQRQGPIDMRMDQTQETTAKSIIEDNTIDELANLIRKYGEERYAGRVARHIKEACEAGLLHSTADLAHVVSEAIPKRDARQRRIHPATRTFQALRMVVNGELEQLETFLQKFPKLLLNGGRCAVISFHSLEDRVAKHTFRELAKTSSLPPKLAEQAGERVHPICHVLTRKPITATEDEIARNPRSRSAKLRVCQRSEFEI